MHSESKKVVTGNFKYLLLLAYLIVLAAGLTSEPCMGDEIYHYRFAKNFFWQNSRPVVDRAYLDYSKEQVVFYYDIFWHFCLSVVWRIAGSICLVAAQLYHSLYYLLLVVFTYLLGKELYDEETGFWGAFIMATVPMIGVFSVLFYIDVPGTLMSVLCIWLLVKKRFFLSGLALGLMYLTKRNAILFMPAILAIAFFQAQAPLRVKAKNTLLLLLAAGLIVIPDMAWRQKHFQRYPPNIFTSPKIIFNRFYGLAQEPARIAAAVSQRASEKLSAVAEQVNRALASFAASSPSKAPVLKSADTPAPKPPKPVRPVQPAMQVELGDVKTFSTMASKDFSFAKYFQDIIFLSYFGFGIFIALLVYIFRRKMRRKDFLLWGLVVSYGLFYAYFMRCSNEVRYLLPIIPFLSIIAAIPLAASKNRFFKGALIFVCLAQLAIACAYVSMKRRIPDGIKAAFAFVKENVPADANLFYIEYIALDKTDRRTFLLHAADPRLIKMFWSKDKREIIGAMNALDIDYLAIRKSRIYEDTDQYYFSGYPRSFVERLGSLDFARQVFDNREISIWEITREGRL